MTVIDTYALQIIRDDDTQGNLGLLALWIAEAEENLTDLLPDGFRARITQWTEDDDD